MGTLNLFYLPKKILTLKSTTLLNNSKEYPGFWCHLGESATLTPTSTVKRPALPQISLL